MYDSDNDTIFDMDNTRAIFGYKTRQNVYKILEGKFFDDNQINIFYRLFGNFLIPMLFSGIVFLYSFFKKERYYFLLSGMILGHSFILFVTSPASYFMYYFNVYLSGWALGIIFISEIYVNKKSNKI